MIPAFLAHQVEVYQPVYAAHLLVANALDPQYVPNMYDQEDTIPTVCIAFPFLNVYEAAGATWTRPKRRCRWR